MLLDIFSISEILQVLYNGGKGGRSREKERERERSREKERGRERESLSERAPERPRERVSGESIARASGSGSA